MDFKFVKKGTDNYELVFKNKEGKEVVKPFIRDISIASKLDSIELRARVRLEDVLKSMGKSKEDYVEITTTQDGKTIKDERRFLALENNAIEIETTNALNECIEYLFKENMIDLLMELGVDIENDGNNPQIAQDLLKFTAILQNIITGKDEVSPSGEVYFKANEPKSQDTN